MNIEVSGDGTSLWCPSEQSGREFVITEMRTRNCHDSDEPYELVLCGPETKWVHYTDNGIENAMNYPPAKDGWVSAPTNSPLIAGLTSGQAANSVVPTVLYFNPSCKIFKAAFLSRSIFSKQLKQNHSLSVGFSSLF